MSFIPAVKPIPMPGKARLRGRMSKATSSIKKMLIWPKNKVPCTGSFAGVQHSSKMPSSHIAGESLRPRSRRTSIITVNKARAVPPCQRRIKGASSSLESHVKRVPEKGG